MTLFKRRPEARKEEAYVARNTHFDSSTTQSIANKLGISSSGVNKEKIIYELNKIKNKPHLLKLLKISDKDLKDYLS